MSKIIIIGNAQSLLSTKRGNIIDSFDKNIRFNGFQIKGYEKQVGQKIDIICFIPTGYGAKVALHEQTRIITNKATELWFSRPIELCKDTYNQILNKFHKNQKIVHPSLKQYNDILEKCNKIEGNNKTPSSGFVAIEMAISLFKDYEIYITGFDQFKSGHYYGRKIIPKCHTIEAEKGLINQYVKKGILKIF
jgi:hypothetical protein